MGASSSKATNALTLEEIRDFTATFKSFDSDNTGSIDSSELEQVLISLGRSPTAEELHQMLEDMDTDGNGTIDLEEFLTTMAKKSTGVEKEIKLAFHVFDSDGDGYITPAEVLTVFKTIGENLTDRQLRRLLRTAGADRLGRVHYKGFSDMLKAKLKDVNKRMERDLKTPI